MPRIDDAGRLKHMLEYAREAVAMAEGRMRTDLDADRQFNLAITRLMEVIGEAAARVSAERQSQLPRIPWPEIIAFRNRLIHGYDNVDADILWEIIIKDLPALISELEQIAP